MFSESGSAINLGTSSGVNVVGSAVQGKLVSLVAGCAEVGGLQIVLVAPPEADSTCRSRRHNAL